jgi:L-ascorbate metabolism protein UlaG (beta-lactamase superfamily)
MLIALGVLVLLFFALAVGLGYAFSGPRYRGPVSDHFDGNHFRNPRPSPHGGLGAFLRWQRTRQRAPWVDRDEAPGPQPPARVAQGSMRVTFVNHATVLLQQDGLNILTDPIWSMRASPLSWVGPRRHHPPGLRFEDLPPIDVVLVGHNHYDHLDLPTLRRLEAAHHPRFFCGLGNRALLEAAGLSRVTELDWWQEVPLNPQLDLIGVPTQHFSNRGLFDRDRTLWLGFVVRGPAGKALFASDTGSGPHFAEIRRRLGPPRLAVLPVGAYRPEWFMGGVHETPAEAVAAHLALGAGTSVGMHFGTFALADDGQDEPARALAAALAQSPAPRPRFWLLGFGEGREVP